ncbi:hypothetical protein HAX54_028004, partial [Datura stramonium]|nr:hypothetical protein [Datura stramonium]
DMDISRIMVNTQKIEEDNHKDGEKHQSKKVKSIVHGTISSRQPTSAPAPSNRNNQRF